VSRTTKPRQFPTHGPELKALLAACHRNPDDDTPRLVLADWLQEHDDPRGELMRLQCRLAAMPAGDPEYDTLFELHQQWWKKYGKLWEKEVGSYLWNVGPHDRGLPTLGNSDSTAHEHWLSTGDLEDPAKYPKDLLSVAVANGWPGMTWVFVEDPLDYGDEEDSDDYALDPEVIEAIAFDRFDQPPWADSPTPIGVCVSDDLLVTPEIIDRAAKIPNLRGLAFVDITPTPDLLPRIAAIKTLEHLDLSDMRLTDDDLRKLTPLKQLRTLNAIGGAITDAGVKTLAEFPELRELRLGTHRFTAKGYQSLAGLAKLEVLQLGIANDSAVQHLSGLTRLRFLELRGTKVTGHGVENFPLLTHLILDGAPVDDEGLAGVAALPRLRYLGLHETRITGAALKHLSSLRWLEELHASETAIRDRDLVHLEPLKQLRLIDFNSTLVTKKGSAALQAKLKNAMIW